MDNYCISYHRVIFSLNFLGGYGMSLGSVWQSGNAEELCLTTINYFAIPCGDKSACFRTNLDALLSFETFYVRNSSEKFSITKLPCAYWSRQAAAHTGYFMIIHNA